MRFFIALILISTLLGCDNKSCDPFRALLGNEHVIINNNSEHFSISSFLKDRRFVDLEMEYLGGDIRSGYLLGLSLMFGYDVAKDEARAVEVLSSVWERGVVDAGYTLYHAYYFGRGVRRDRDVAFYFLRTSAESGYVRSQWELALAYEGLIADGIVKKDVDKALQWYIKAAQGGDKRAATNVAQFYYDGRTVARDESKVYEWLSLAVTLPYGDEMTGFRGLARVYEEGVGTDIDLVQAYKYYDLLSPAGDDDKARLAGQMTPEQIHEAISLSRQWQEEHNIFVPSYYGLEYQEDGTFQ